MTAWAVLDLATCAVALGALVALHLFPTGLQPAKAAVSEYGIGAYRVYYRVLTVALGVAGVAAARIAAAAHAQPVVVVLLALFGASRLVISWVPMDPVGAAPTPRGHAHRALAVAAFGSAAVVAGRLTASGAVFGVAALLCVTGFVGMLATPRWFGAAERVVYAGILVLSVAVAVVLG